MWDPAYREHRHRFLKERKKDAPDSITIDDSTSFSNPIPVSRSPQLPPQSGFQRTVTPESLMTDGKIDLQIGDHIDQFDPDYNGVTTLSLVETDDGATDDSSADSYASGRVDKKHPFRRKKGKHSTNNNFDSHEITKPRKQCEVGKYMAAREMTPWQERMNALTVLPSSFYCILFFFYGWWLSEPFIENQASVPMDDSDFDNTHCITSRWVPHLYALPPLPPLAAAIGILCHAPFSMIYHWRYAHRLPPGLARTTHWSRRMDQAMIHFCSACLSYSTSGRLDFFLLNAVFNIHCFYLQFLKQVQPRRNQVRIGISVLMNTIPILLRGELLTYLKLCVLYSVGGWLFGQYPIGGWSHSAFHIVMAFIPPLMFTTALGLPSSQSQLKVAVQCAILAENTLAS